VDRLESILLLAGLAWLVGCGPLPAEELASQGLLVVVDDGVSNELVRVRMADGTATPFLASPGANETWPLYSVASNTLLVEVRPPDRILPVRLRLVALGSGREWWAHQADESQTWPAWAPDGRRFAYVFQGRSQNRSGVAVVELSTGRREVIHLDGSGEQMRRPRFAPDSRRIVAQDASKGSSRLWILEPGAAPVPLTHGDGFDQKPRFGRDGRWIVFGRSETKKAPSQVMRVRPDGSGLSAVTEGMDCGGADPSPTRDELAFVCRVEGGPGDLFLSAIDGSELRRLTHGGWVEGAAPRWSPDGERISLTVRRKPRAPLPLRRTVRVLYLHTLVLDRSGEVLLDVPGGMAEWFPPLD
jgi:hypothetical protein